jgi:K+/H+ antiporter YhaU regulatory subunit KhtT
MVAKSTIELSGRTIGDIHVRETYGVAVLAIKRPDGWIVAPRGDTELRAGDELFVVGTRDALRAFEGVVA